MHMHQSVIIDAGKSVMAMSVQGYGIRRWGRGRKGEDELGRKTVDLGQDR
jgi:hypothetical protein